MRTIACYVLLFIVSVSQVEAGVINVAQWLPNKLIEEELLNQSISTSINEPILSIKVQDFTPTLNNVYFTINGSVTSIDLGANGFSARANNLSAVLDIGSITIDQTIVKVIAGNQISIHLQANCQEFKISIPRFSLNIEAIYQQTNGKWSPNLNQTGLEIPSNGWSITDIKCSGIDGIATEIANELNKAISTPSELQSFLQEWINSQVEVLWAQTLQSLISSSSQDFLITEIGRPSDLGLLIYGQLVISKNKSVPLPTINESLLSQNAPQLILSQNGLSSIVEDRLLAMIPSKYNLQEISAFKNLMNSRLAQSFVWPDLKRFPSSTPFYIATDSDQSSLILKSTSSPSIFNVQLRGVGFLQTVIQYSLINYLNWDMLLNTNATLNINQGKLSVSTGTAEINLNWYFSPLYVLIYKPNQKITTSVFQDSLKTLFSNQSSSQTLPSLQIQNKTWKISSYKTQGDMLTMDWSAE